MLTELSSGQKLIERDEFQTHARRSNCSIIEKIIAIQAIARSKTDLDVCVLKYNDEVSTLVLEQDWWKSFYRPNRCAKISNFSKQPVRALKLSTDAKQKI